MQTEQHHATCSLPVPIMAPFLLLPFLVHPLVKGDTRTLSLPVKY